jgi:pyruvate,water dikinase
MNRSILLVALVACAKPTPEFVDESDCAEAEARLGFRACIGHIADSDTFTDITIPAVTVDQLRTGKYMVPATSSAKLPPVFLDVNAFPLHYDFLTQAFPDDFTGLTTDQYEDLILHPETREYYAGTISLYLDGDGFFYGFTVWDDPSDPTSTVTVDDVTKAWEQLKERFTVGELEWVPNSSAQTAASQQWDHTAFPMHAAADVAYEGYSLGSGIGYLRLYSLDDFVTASDNATYGYQDFVVVEEAPEDIYRVVSGIVTGSRQGTLSHLNVRSASRGTPNCYLKDPLTALAEYKDQLVKFTCDADTWHIEPATPEEATDWWTSIRPVPVTICDPDSVDFEMPALLEADTSTAEKRHTNLCTYGAKASNLSTLYHLIPTQYQLDGFMVPFAYYERFIHEEGWIVDLDDGQGAAYHTFADTITAWHQDATFTTDATVRVKKLDALRAAFFTAPVPPDIITAVADRIKTVYGSDRISVRFRSSSNAEDGVGFSGAGLYESRTACVADEYDGDSLGPSQCDPDKDEERTLSDALRWVWASVWKLSAWEERDWYGIDQNKVAMGMLSDPRAKNEQANIVAFSGNPLVPGDDRYLINAQIGDLEVVIPKPGVYPEKELLTVVDGEVTDIDRVAPSSEADIVLSDDQLKQLGGVFSTVINVYPRDEEAPEGHDILWDTEWKYLEDGSLKIKQIRPWLR